MPQTKSTNNPLPASLAHLLKFEGQRTQRVVSKVWPMGGFHVAHAHIDRAFTDDNSFYKIGIPNPSRLSLLEKQDRTENLIESAYTRESLTARMKRVLDLAIELGVTRFDSFVNIGERLPEDGLIAVNVAAGIATEYQKKIDFRFGTYPMFGFRDDQPQRWELLRKSLKVCNFIGTLPERDCYEYYGASSEHIGFMANLERTISLAIDENKPLHIHLDQQNSGEERGTENLISMVASHEKFSNSELINQEEPFIWAVHAISPSCYTEERFRRLAQGLAKYNIGLIVCPSAALSMVQLREQQSPLHNCIARAFDFIKYGVKVRVGIDNISDMYLPMTSPNPLYELKLLSDSLRFYYEDILAYMMSGKNVPEILISKIGDDRS